MAPARYPGVLDRRKTFSGYDDNTDRHNHFLFAMIETKAGISELATRVAYSTPMTALLHLHAPCFIYSPNNGRRSSVKERRLYTSTPPRFSFVSVMRPRQFAGRARVGGSPWRKRGSRSIKARGPRPGHTKGSIRRATL